MIISHVTKIAYKSMILSRFSSRLIVRFIAIKSFNLTIINDFFVHFCNEIVIYRIFSKPPVKKINDWNWLDFQNSIGKIKMISTTIFTKIHANELQPSCTLTPISLSYTLTPIVLSYALTPISLYVYLYSSDGIGSSFSKFKPNRNWNL
jgi:hypothetical protein